MMDEDAISLFGLLLIVSESRFERTTSLGSCMLNRESHELLDQFGQQKGRHRGKDERNQGQTERMRENVAIAIFATREGANEIDDAPGEQQQQRQDRTQLNDDRVHLPVRV